MTVITVILGIYPNIPNIPNNTVLFRNIPNINGKGNNNGNLCGIYITVAFIHVNGNKARKHGNTAIFVQITFIYGILRKYSEYIGISTDYCVI